MPGKFKERDVPCGWRGRDGEGQVGEDRAERLCGVRVCLGDGRIMLALQGLSK